MQEFYVILYNAGDPFDDEEILDVDSNLFDSKESAETYTKNTYGEYRCYIREVKLFKGA